MPSAFVPLILLQGDKYRFVKDFRDNGNGVYEPVYTIEFLDGQDAMHQPRWVSVNKRDALSSYAGAMNWLQEEFARHLAGQEQV